jgi:hypothetical protein
LSVDADGRAGIGGGSLHSLHVADGGEERRPGRLKVLFDLESLNSLSFSLVAEENSARLVLLLLANRDNPL